VRDPLNEPRQNKKKSQMAKNQLRQRLLAHAESSLAEKIYGEQKKYLSEPIGKVVAVGQNNVQGAFKSLDTRFRLEGWRREKVDDQGGKEDTRRRTGVWKGLKSTHRTGEQSAKRGLRQLGLIRHTSKPGESLRRTISCRLREK